MSQSGKLFSAIAPVAAGISAAQSGALRAAKCSSLQQNAAAQRKNAGTNPNPKSVTLSPRQQMAAVLLLRGKSNSAVARELGINRATVARWQKLPVFTAEIHQRVDAAARPAPIRQVPQVTPRPTLRELLTRKYQRPMQALTTNPPVATRPEMSQHVAECSSLQQRSEKQRNEPTGGMGHTKNRTQPSEMRPEDQYLRSSGALALSS